ncbi:MAG TPA: succinate dehydrogenase assembly factor 2 [Croceibacterium sp.]|nr:succinate dehydrogenase assembly factor 2 [Croceibacterium sp.]
MPDLSTRISRARFRAWHRGTREADFMIGGFFDRHHASWGDAEVAWFEALLEEDDVDIMAWAMRARPAPAEYAGPMLQALERLDYITI